VTRGNFKADPRSIVRAHRRTYITAGAERPRWQDLAVFDGLPIVVLVVCVIFNVQLPVVASAGLITVSGVLSVFLFTVVVQVWARAMDLADARPEQSAATSQQVINLEELAANSGYASLVSIGAAVVFVMASISSHWVLRISSALGLAVGAHLVLVLMMVMKRVFLQTRQRLARARSGADLLDETARR
jgi:hypothetical protein